MSRLYLYFCFMTLAALLSPISNRIFAEEISQCELSVAIGEDESTFHEFIGRERIIEFLSNWSNRTDELYQEAIRDAAKLEERGESVSIDVIKCRAAVVGGIVTASIASIQGLEPYACFLWGIGGMILGTALVDIRPPATASNSVIKDDSKSNWTPSELAELRENNGGFVINSAAKGLLLDAMSPSKKQLGRKNIAAIISDRSKALQGLGYSFDPISLKALSYVLGRDPKAPRLDYLSTALDIDDEGYAQRLALVIRTEMPASASGVSP